MRTLNNFPRSRQAKGFSLLEVLVAVVILSIGLLALASLQFSLIRSSTESKAQTTAVALAKEQIESIKAFSDLAAYRAVTSLAKPTNPNVLDSTNGAGSLGGIDFKRWWTVNRYVFNGTNFVNVGTGLLTADDAALVAANALYVPGNEFKRIAMSVAWNDANGVEQQVTIEDAIASIAPADSALLYSTSTIKSRGPKVLINNPGLEQGVIPIALGSDSATAATNPKPEVISQGQNTNVVETRFDVLTYSNINASAVQAQQRVETAVLGCKCNASATTGTAYRPTYWDGVRYVPPTTFSPVPVSVPATGVTQSAKCTICCRDHFDPAAAPGRKFDERRTAPHSHYLETNLTTPVATGAYHESCRLIRVDGFFRTATDTFDDYFGLLETDNTGTAPYAPKNAAKVRYERFVIDYLKQRYITGINTTTPPATAKTQYNTPINAAGIAVLEEASPAPSMNSPTEITINSSTAPRWLHSRGLYIDYLSDEAADAIALARDYCATNTSLCTGTTVDPNLQTRILSLLPFTSINVTEIASWTSNLKNGGAASERVIKMDNTIGFANSADPQQVEPVKGKVLLGTNYTDVANHVDNTADATTTIGPSNSGLALVKAVDPADVVTAATTDLQPFRIAAGGSGNPDPQGGTFTVTISGANEILIAANSPYVAFTPSPSPDRTNCAANGVGVIPYTCSTATGQVLGNSSLITVGNYNRQVAAVDSTVQVLNTCTSTAGDRTGMPFREYLDVASITSSNGLATVSAPLTVVNAEALGIYPTGEYTTATVTPVNGQVQNSPNPGDTITVNFSSAKKFFCPNNYNNGNFVAVKTGPQAGRTCTNNPELPIWSTTFVLCPGGGTSLPTPP